MRHEEMNESGTPEPQVKPPAKSRICRRQSVVIGCIATILIVCLVVVGLLWPLANDTVSLREAMSPYVPPSDACEFMIVLLNNYGTPVEFEIMFSGDGGRYFNYTGLVMYSEWIDPGCSNILAWEMYDWKLNDWESENDFELGSEVYVGMNFRFNDSGVSWGYHWEAGLYRNGVLGVETGCEGGAGYIVNDGPRIPLPHVDVTWLFF